MIGLYRVPEIETEASPLPKVLSERIWSIARQNFTPDFEAHEMENLDGEFETVVLTTKQGAFRQEWLVSLANFQHPEKAVYVIGPDNRNLLPSDIPQQLQKLKTHFVFIPTDNPASMWGHVVWTVTMWDRRSKGRS